MLVLFGGFSAKRSVVAGAAVAMLAGCASSLQPTPAGSDAMSLAAESRAVSTVVHRGVALHPDRGRSWMLPEGKRAPALLYADDWATNDVFVYDYKSGKQVGQLTGFDEPYGGCVDKKGDVYITNFGNGTTVEYAHGGTSPLKTFTTNGYPIGCSVDAKNDLAVTDFYTGAGPGSITVWAGGSGSPTSYSDSSACYYMWPAGYDGSGNLYVEGEYSKIVLCELPKGSSSMRAVSLSGGTIDFPASTFWDGKYLTLGDQEAGGTYQTSISQVTQSGSGNLTVVGTTSLQDNCYGDYVDVVNYFIVGKKNAPLNRAQGNVLVGGNLWCAQSGSGNGISFWHYPAGGMPFRNLSGAAEVYGAVVSLAP